MDTSAAAHAAQALVWERMGPLGRFSLAVRMSEEVAEIAREGIARRHPEYTAEEVRHAWIRLRLGDALFRRVYPSVPLLPP
jgi:hypothetical protein